MAQGRVWLSKNVLGVVCRNDVSRLVGNCRKKMLFVLSVVCGLAESAFSENLLNMQILRPQIGSLNQAQPLEGQPRNLFQHADFYACCYTPLTIAVTQ